MQPSIMPNAIALFTLNVACSQLSTCELKQPQQHTRGVSDHSLGSRLTIVALNCSSHLCSTHKRVNTSNCMLVLLLLVVFKAGQTGWLPIQSAPHVHHSQANQPC